MNDQPKPRSIMVLTPIRERPSAEYMVSLIQLLDRLRAMGIRISVQLSFCNHITYARNRLCAQFLESDFDDAVFIDDDVGFDAESVWRLHTSDKPVIGGVIHKRNPKPNTDPHAWAFGWQKNPASDKSGLEVDYVGTGFLKIAREALKTLIEKRPDLHRPNMVDQEGVAQPDYHRFFFFGPNEEGEDVMFCRMWREIGEKVWIDPGITLSHMGLFNFTGNVAECMQQKREAAE